MTVSIRQIHPVFMGEVSGVDLRRPLEREDVAAIEAGMDEYAVLVFHGQDITDEQQLAFSANLGTIELPRSASNITKPEERRIRPDDGGCLESRPATTGRSRAMTGGGCSTSATGSGIPIAPSARCRRNTRCSQAASFRRSGGNTEFADMRAAYDALDDATKQRSRTWSASTR